MELLMSRVDPLADAVVGAFDGTEGGRVGVVLPTFGFELAVQRHPDDVEAQMQLGSVLDLEGHYPEAIEHFQKAITLGPDHPGAYHQLALCLSKVQKRKEAIAACREGLRIYPFSFALLNNLAWALAMSGE